MATISISGVCTLAGVVLAGPLTWSLISLAGQMKRSPPASSADDESQEDHAEKAEIEAKTGSGESREEVGHVEYLLALMGYAIGIGNLWRFPYLVGKWGGGAFVFAYLVSLVLVAAPLYLVEMAMGHQTRRSTIDCFKAIHPRWLGLGMAQAFMLFCCLTYFNVLIAYASYYVSASLVSPLPWSPEASGGQSQGGKSLNYALMYWKSVVKLPEQVALDDGLGPVQWKLALALLSVWLIVLFALAFGKRVLAKVTWVTVVSPVIMLAVLLIQSLTLEGAGNGISFYIGKFDYGKLLDVELWATACSQILFSLSPGFGTAISMSSYTRPKEDVIKVCISVAFCNSAFSIIGGFAIFSILGHLAHTTGQTVAEVASSSGPGLAFVAIAEAMQGYGRFANVASVLFFLTLLTLGLDSTFAWAETFVSIADDYCRGKGWKTPKIGIVIIICLTGFLLGLPYCTPLGSCLLDVVDHYVGSIFLLFACCFEAVVFTLGYTWTRLAAGLRSTTGKELRPTRFYQFLLGFVIPCATGLLALHLISANLRKSYGGYPAGLLAVGWSLLAVCVGLFTSTLCLSGQSTLPKMCTSGELKVNVNATTITSGQAV